MPCSQNKIDSNVASTSYAEEECLKQLPTTPTWNPLEPNSFSDFGGSIATVARNPINQSRQRKKGVVTDLDAAGGFNQDLTQDNLRDLLQGFMFADLRKKGEAKNPPGITTQTLSMTAATSRITRVAGAIDFTTQFDVADLVKVDGFSDAANNGLFKVSAVTATTLDLSDADGTDTAATVIDEAATAVAFIVDVGVETGAGDLDVDDTGSFPALTSTVLDFTTLGLVIGEWVYLGGDVVAVTFGTAANSGYARVRTIAANRLEFDKTETTFVTEANATLLVQMFTGQVLKNESGSLIKRRTYQLERQLGAPDPLLPAQIQSEYVIGAVPGELTINVSTADKITLDLSFLGSDHETRSGVTGVKTGLRPALAEADAFNTSSDFSRIKLAVHTDADAVADALFAFVTDLTLTINNNLSGNKAIGVLGNFDVTAGIFAVGGGLTAYFSDVAAIQTVRDNADVTLDAHIAKNNAGITFDVPLLTLGDARANVEQDQPITLPITNEAADGSKIDPNLNHTLLFVFFDFLPSVAE